MRRQRNWDPRHDDIFEQHAQGLPKCNSYWCYHKHQAACSEYELPCGESGQINAVAITHVL